jgi:hypothetical protein
MDNIIKNNRLIAEFIGYNEEIVNDEDTTVFIRGSS